MSDSRVSSVPRRPILLLWGVLTLLGVVCAYLIGIALAVGCALLCLAGFASFSLGGVILGIGAGIGGITIVWSLLPRRDRFTPPGPALDIGRQPRLLAEVATIATDFDEPMPDDVYLIAEPNAWVAQRGGILGFGSRRVMALGLPLLATLTVAEFRAILAHEFAHYYGGDTGIGPWVQRARVALARSLQSLTSDSGLLAFFSRWGYVAILRLLVIWIFALYWKLFLRLTLLVSRQAEYRADELACALAGPGPLVTGLRKVETAAISWPGFWQTEALPTLSDGFRAPLAEGYSQYLAAPAIAKRLPQELAAHLEAEKPTPFATHPTFKQRAARAGSYGLADMPADHAPALSLLEDLPRLESALLEAVFPDAHAGDLPQVDWGSVGGTIYLPKWVAFTGEYRALLHPYAVASLPDAVAAIPSLAANIPDPKGRLLTREQRADRAASLLWTALALVLVHAGWQLHAGPGDFRLVQGNREIEPVDVISRLRRNQMSADAFRTLARESGIADAPLAPGMSGTGRHALP